MLLMLVMFVIGAGTVLGAYAGIMYVPGVMAKRRLDQRLQDMTLQLLHPDHDAENDQSLDRSDGDQGDQHRHRAGQRGADDGDEGTEENQRGQRYGDRQSQCRDTGERVHQPLAYEAEALRSRPGEPGPRGGTCCRAQRGGAGRSDPVLVALVTPLLPSDAAFGPPKMRGLLVHALTFWCSTGRMA